MALTKFQINAVKSMARGLTPLTKKLEKIHAKESEFLTNIALEKEAIQQQIDQINNGIIAYTGGLTLNEVLNPSSTINESVEGQADDTESVDMTQIIPEVETEEIITMSDTNVESPTVEEVTDVKDTEETPFWDKPQ